MHNDKKSQSDPLVFLTKFHELLSDFLDYETIFTDGSKDGDTAGSACVSPSDTYKCRLSDSASIFSAEIKAIDLALDHIEQSRNSDFIIFLARLDEVQKSLCTTPGVGVGVHIYVKVFSMAYIFQIT